MTTKLRERTMKLSDSTLSILRNFAGINNSILVKQGNRLRTISVAKNILAEANLTEEFPSDFALYDLNQFLNVNNSLFRNPELDFTDRGYVVISEGKSKQTFFFADPNVIVTPPDKDITLPTEDVCFELSTEQLDKLLKAAAINQLPDFSAIGKDGKVTLVVRDKKNDTSNNYSVKVGTTNAKFTFNFKVEYLKLLPADYGVTISKQNAALFRDANRDLEYLIALEPDSVYNG